MAVTEGLDETRTNLEGSDKEKLTVMASNWEKVVEFYAKKNVLEAHK